MQIAIKLNSLDSNCLCSICNQEEFANVGPHLFMADSWRPVCRDCGDQHAPELSSLLDLAVAARAFSLSSTEVEAPALVC